MPSIWRSVPNRSMRPGEELVGVGLVTGVPDDPVRRRVEEPVEGDRDLDDAEARAEVAAGLRDGRDDRVPDLRGERLELRLGQPAEVGRAGEAGEERVGHEAGRHSWLRAWRDGSRTSGCDAASRRRVYSESLGRLLPDGNVLAALARERLALPAAPALAEAEARHLGHEVELGRPDVAERPRAVLDPPVDDVKWCEISPWFATSYSSIPQWRSPMSNTTAVAPSGSRRRSGIRHSITKHPPGARCRAALRNAATCPACVVRFSIVL